MPQFKYRPTLHKVLFQALYKPRLEFYNLLYSAAAAFTNYGHWETNNLAVVLYEPERRCHLVIGHNSITYDWDHGGTSDCLEDIRHGLLLLTPSLQLNEFDRLGFRKQYLVPVDMSFEETTTILNVKFLSQSEHLLSIFPSGVNDMTYTAIGGDGKLDVRVQLGPMRRQEAPNHIAINQKFNFGTEKLQDYVDVVNGYPEVSVFIDIDVSCKQPKMDTEYGLEFLGVAERIHQERIIMLKDYIFSEVPAT